MFGFRSSRKSSISFTVNGLPRRSRLSHVYTRPGDEEPIFELEAGDHCVAPQGPDHTRTDPASDLRLMWVECGEKGEGWVLDGILDYATVNR